MPERPWRVGASAGAMQTTLRLDGRSVDLALVSATATAGYHPGPRFGLSLGVGAVLDGRIDAGLDGPAEVAPGFIASVSASWLAGFERPRRPFVLLTASAALSRTHAGSASGGSHPLTAGDLRVGVMVGKRLGPVVPYVAARVFGGPVFWTLDGADVVGGDVHHYTVGAGASVRLHVRLDGFVEIMPLGEQSASAGLTLSL